MQRGQEVCAKESQHGGLGLEFCSDHWLNLFCLVDPSSNHNLPDGLSIQLCSFRTICLQSFEGSDYKLQSRTIAVGKAVQQ